MISAADFQSYAGPGDKNLPMTEISGYQPVSRIGEVVMNAFVDAYEFSALKYQQLNAAELVGGSVFTQGAENQQNGNAIVEFKPHFHEWATVQPGMVCLARKKKTAVFRQYVAAETAVPVIACAACIPKEDEPNYFFAGVARSQSVRTPDDGIGPNVDEFFTVSIGGMATLLNTSGGPIFPGDLVEWTLASADTYRTKQTISTANHRAMQGPRRVAIQVASVSSPKIIGRSLSFAKKGETLDILLKQ